MNSIIHDTDTQAVYLVLNAGSSSLKFSLYVCEDETPILTGQVDQIGPNGSLKLRVSSSPEIVVSKLNLNDHSSALRAVMDSIQQTIQGLRVVAVGHRVVHGGALFAEPVWVTDEVLDALEALVPYAPLHQPHNLAGIRTAMRMFPGIPQVACFDTAFHRTHDFVNDAFAIPFRYYEKGVRRYGFHGLSYAFIASTLKDISPDVYAGRVIVAHLGNGASMCAMRHGASVASSMGFSALDGLPMGTRCGQLDPGVIFYMLDQDQLTPQQVMHILYSESGLLGLSGGLSNDMRTLEASRTPEASRAIDYFVARSVREIGALAASMGGLDAIVFTGGIGENSTTIRARIGEQLTWLGVEIDPILNNQQAQRISSDGSDVSVWVIPTHEDLVIARAIRHLLTDLAAV